MKIEETIKKLKTVSLLNLYSQQPNLIQTIYDIINVIDYLHDENIALKKQLQQLEADFRVNGRLK